MTHLVRERTLNLVTLRFVVRENYERVVVEADATSVFSHHSLF